MTGTFDLLEAALAQALHSQGVGCHGRDSAERHANDAKRLTAAGWRLVEAAELDRLQRRAKTLELVTSGVNEALQPTGEHRLFDGYCPDCGGQCLRSWLEPEPVT